jgi:hypothetical protein
VASAPVAACPLSLSLSFSLSLSGYRLYDRYNREIVKNQEAIREEERQIREGKAADDQKRREIFEKSQMQKYSLTPMPCHPLPSPALFCSTPPLLLLLLYPSPAAALPLPHSRLLPLSTDRLIGSSLLSPC